MARLNSGLPSLSAGCPLSSTRTGRPPRRSAKGCRRPPGPPSGPRTATLSASTTSTRWDGRWSEVLERTCRKKKPPGASANKPSRAPCPSNPRPLGGVGDVQYCFGFRLQKVGCFEGVSQGRMGCVRACSVVCFVPSRRRPVLGRDAPVDTTLLCGASKLRCGASTLRSAASARSEGASTGPPGFGCARSDLRLQCEGRPGQSLAPPGIALFVGRLLCLLPEPTSLSYRFASPA